ncbi:hypothetical protein HOLleu_17945 [Holothuria leucospilota]|uniref:Uncharacterized protein n=1 Tax=Holothuria leucospilota TaxID=206669 RepID=A0A9Q1C2I4_HOLLE|nr:hypothetical protein HOLleu_17945 [Holothuria leucospilota]
MSNTAFNWQDVPCHFTWGMNRVAKQVLESSFTFQKENAELYPDDEDACYMFVYLAYLEFVTGKNVGQGTDGSLHKADKIIDRMEDESGKKVFQLVSLANRAWILSLSRKPQETVVPITSQLLCRYEEHLSSENIEKEKAYLDAIEGFAFRRIFLDEQAEEKYKSAIRVIPDIAMWHFELGRVAGSSLMTTKDKMEAKLPHLKRALQLKPDYVPCMVKLIECLVRVGNLDDARVELDRLGQYDTSNNPKAICVTASFYMRAGDMERALEILHEAERLHYSVIYDLLATAYLLKATSVSPLRREQYLKKSLTYVEKCLSKHPGSYDSIITKFEVLCRLKVSADKVESFLRKLNEERSIPPSLFPPAFHKMITIFDEVNKSNLHPDLEILLSLYESMVTILEVTSRECLESGSDEKEVYTEKYRVTLEKAQFVVDKYLSENKELEDMNGRFRVANEKARSAWEQCCLCRLETKIDEDVEVSGGFKEKGSVSSLRQGP